MMIIVLFKLIACLSIWVLGLTAASQERMILYSWREWAEEKYYETQNRLMEPLLLCHWCMPSIHSIFVYAIAIGSGIVTWSWNLVLIWPLVVFGSSMLNGVVWATYQLISSATEHYKNLNAKDNEYEIESSEIEAFDYEQNNN